MRPTIYTVQRPGAGTISTMGKPRSNRWLAGDMTALREMGVDILVSAMTLDERLRWGLGDEEKAALEAGLQFVEIPIPDRTVPNRAEIASAIAHLTGEYRAGRHIVFHCWAGIGRSSLLAASVLVLDGETPERAWELITDARGFPVPDTEEQRAWLQA
ncbi:hypothetical protein Lesp02_52160 [Lentzea sp. NBRC 105346]|uniref:protein-tyrosine phosphatase family protein n=1 Tax=Lentzea sp. NBRC 105346 TaxID=3032205 RepID=UPI0024A2B746|nr:hypothetical protein [Lentzea sp. NBRC 105346]GLZ33028.1 hypothetical protein Lesp02_52160 [Lentzea sp. NBRC 105346]